MVGSVVISVDAELGWGFHDFSDRPDGQIEAGRTGWRHLLDLFDEFRIPATWAVVGHLFLDECDGVHAEHPTPPEWFEHEREEWRSRPEFRFGGELIEDLLNADVDHDIGSHTFSHVLFDEDWVTPRVVNAELEMAIEVAKRHGVDYDSFVFPRNIVGFREQLAEHDFTAYRGHMPGGIRWTASKLAGLVAPSRTRVVDPYVDECGLVNVPPSLYLFGIEGPARAAIESVWTDPIVQLTRNGIDRAILEDGMFHMWLHPNNLTAEQDIRRMRAILEHIDERRNDSEVTVETMADVAERVRS